MEHERDIQQEFPTAGVELMHLIVVSDYLRFAGNQIILSTPGGPTKDKPMVTFAPPTNQDEVSSELTIRVPDCEDAYEVLCSRGAEFLTPPVDWGYEVRAFFRDPDGHLLEISQNNQQWSQEVRGE